MRIRACVAIGCLAASLVFVGAWTQEGQPKHTHSLLGGEELTGWTPDIPAADENPDIEASFIWRDGMLVSLGTPLGHLVSEAVFENYRLDIEYRFAGEAGNCGVLVHASKPRALYGMFPKSIEVQMHSGNAGDFWCIGENIAVEDMAKRRAGEPETWGGGPDDSRRILNMTDHSEKPVGEWNRMIIECVGDRVRVWVNGDLVNDGFDCTAKRGHIALQAEGAEVEFRRLDLTQIHRQSPARAWSDETASPAAREDEGQGDD
jgi:3-keto-disaccharide hydrolase